jgi:hypothetical protein
MASGYSHVPRDSRDYNSSQRAPGGYGGYSAPASAAPPAALAAPPTYNNSARGYGGASSSSGYGGGGGGGYGGGGYGGGGYRGQAARGGSGGYSGGGGGGGLGASLNSNISWDLTKLAVFEKNFYMEHPDVTKMTEKEVLEIRKKHDIAIVGENIPKPVRTFEEASFPQYVLDEVKKLGFEKPTGIQMQGWPMALSGRDMIGIAATGSGKTLAFILPGIVHINAQVSTLSSPHHFLLLLYSFLFVFFLMLSVHFYVDSYLWLVCSMFLFFDLFLL